MGFHTAIPPTLAMVALLVIQYVRGTQIAHAPIMLALGETDHAGSTSHARVHAARADRTHRVMVKLLEEDAQTYVGVDAIL